MPEDFAKTLNKAQAQLTCVVNPHAPSGHFTDIDDLRALAEQLSGVLLVDEAYVDFVDVQGPADATALVRDLDNVLILRTFSKGYSLAGLRLGYLLGAPSLIQPILETRDSYNVDAVSQTSARSIEDQPYAQHNGRRRTDREGLADAPKISVLQWRRAKQIAAEVPPVPRKRSISGT